MNNIKEIYNYYVGSFNKYNRDKDIKYIKIKDKLYIASGVVFYVFICIIPLIIIFYYINKSSIRWIRLFICLTIVLLLAYIYFLVIRKKLYSYSYIDDNNNKKCEKIRLIEPPSVHNSNIIFIIFGIIYVILLTFYIISTNLLNKFISSVEHSKRKKFLFRIFNLDDVKFEPREDNIRKNPNMYGIMSLINITSSFYSIFRWGINIFFIISYPIIYAIHIILVRVILYFIGRYMYYNKLSDNSSKQILALIFDKNRFFFDLSDKIKSGKEPYNKDLNNLNNNNKNKITKRTNLFSRLPYGIPWTSALSIIEKIMLYKLIKRNEFGTIDGKVVSTTTTTDINKNILNFTDINPSNKKLYNFGKDSHIFSFPMSLFVD